MLAKDLRRLGRLLIPLAVIGWGVFALLFSGHLDSVPAPVWWLAVVFFGCGWSHGPSCPAVPRTRQTERSLVMGLDDDRY
jgi:hypothetical protein